jgi:uncharacterized OB-fold protein
MNGSFPLADLPSASGDDALADWTLGGPGIVYQRCDECGSNWYFQRSFCPHCGSTSTSSHQASGQGMVYSLTHLHRAPTDALRQYAPYTLVLVDAKEGFRMMAHGNPELQIGDRVQATFREIAGALLPFFDRTPT